MLCNSRMHHKIRKRCYFRNGKPLALLCCFNGLSTKSVRLDALAISIPGNNRNKLTGTKFNRFFDKKVGAIFF